MAVSLPAVLLIADWYPLRRILSGRDFIAKAVEKIPFLVFSLLISYISVISQRDAGALSLTGVIPLPMRLMVAFRALMMYLYQIMVPVRLIPFYPYPKGITFFSFEALSAIIVVSGITAISIVLVKRQRVWLSLWSYYPKNSDWKSKFSITS
jgi:hypothetical protein